MSASEVTIRWSQGDEDIRGAIGVRKVVFCDEQGVPVEEELDGLDEEALHLVATDSGSGQVIATLRLLLDGEVVKVGRVAVDSAWRRRGIASRMLAAALERAKQHSATSARLAAQIDAVELYEKAGFEVQSEVFQEAGIDHVWMGRRLNGDLRQAPELVVFDCDGVLVDSELISNGLLAQMICEQGLQVTLEQTRARYQGLLLEDIRVQAEAELEHQLPEDWLEEYASRRAKIFDLELRAIDGARPLVEAVVAKGAAVCVASQGSLEKTNRSLELTGLSHLFPPHARFSAHLVPRGKPHPDLFLHAAAAMGVDRSRCVVVEDTPSGVTAAVRAGMPVFGFAADSDRDALQRAGARTFDALEELPTLLWPAAQDG